MARELSVVVRVFNLRNLRKARVSYVISNVDVTPIERKKDTEGNLGG
jgi:hypothetical protein